MNGRTYTLQHLATDGPPSQPLVVRLHGDGPPPIRQVGVSMSCSLEWNIQTHTHTHTPHTHTHTHPHRSSLQKVSCMFQCLTSCPLHLYFVVIRFLSASNQDQHASRFWHHLVIVSTITISFPAKPYRHQRASGLRHHWCHLHTSE